MQESTISSPHRVEPQTPSASVAASAARAARPPAAAPRASRPATRSPAASKAARCRCSSGCRSCKGFNNPFRVEYQAVNLDAIEASGSTTSTPRRCYATGLVHKGALVKVLGRGELTRAVTCQGPRVLQVLPKRPSPAPAVRSSCSRCRSAAGRPSAAKGNQLTNR